MRFEKNTPPRFKYCSTHRSMVAEEGWGYGYGWVWGYGYRVRFGLGLELGLNGRGIFWWGLYTKDPTKFHIIVAKTGVG